jgi:hypothetical protein
MSFKTYLLMENIKQKLLRVALSSLMVSALFLNGGCASKKSSVNNAGKPKAIAVTPKVENPFNLAMAGYTFVNFDLETTLKIMKKLDVRYLCIKDFHLPFNSTDEQIAAFT